MDDSCCLFFPIDSHSKYAYNSSENSRIVSNTSNDSYQFYIRLQWNWTTIFHIKFAFVTVHNDSSVLKLLKLKAVE